MDYIKSLPPLVDNLPNGKIVIKSMIVLGWDFEEGKLLDTVKYGVLNKSDPELYPITKEKGSFLAKDYVTPIALTIGKCGVVDPNLDQSGVISSVPNSDDCDVVYSVPYQFWKPLLEIAMCNKLLKEHTGKSVFPIEIEIENLNPSIRSKWLGELFMGFKIELVHHVRDRISAMYGHRLIPTARIWKPKPVKTNAGMVEEKLNLIESNVWFNLGRKAKTHIYHFKKNHTQVVFDLEVMSMAVLKRWLSKPVEEVSTCTDCASSCPDCPMVQCPDCGYLFCTYCYWLSYKGTSGKVECQQCKKVLSTPVGVEHLKSESREIYKRVCPCRKK